MEILWKIAAGLGAIVLIEIGIIVAYILFASIVAMFREKKKK